MEKGAEFIGPHCQVFLFSKTKIPMVQYTNKKQDHQPAVQLKTFDWIQPKAVKAFYNQMILKKRPSLINDIGRSKKIKADIKLYFMSNRIRLLWRSR